MFENKTKKITTWVLIVNGERITFRTKKLAIEWGKNAITLGCNNAELYEEYNFFDITKRPATHISKESFNRTLLIK